jgi:hypothetical protein
MIIGHDSMRAWNITATLVLNRPGSARTAPPRRRCIGISLDFPSVSRAGQRLRIPVVRRLP